MEANKTRITELNAIVLAAFVLLRLSTSVEVPAEAAVPIVTILNIILRFLVKKGWL